MADLTSLLRAGAILPVDADVPRDERAGEVVAHGYTHPALVGRAIVRLAVNQVVPGADAEMDALGFTRSSVVSKLGRQRFRALGFPGWALVNDPKRASFALEVTRDFKKAKKRVRSKPGHARDAFVAIADQLGRSVPHFLPSFWEEAGRAFLEEDSESFAAQCFEKARLVEKEHKLPIDEDVRSAVYLEFALSGAVAAKSLAGYAKELEKRYGAEAAYTRYRELALRRTLGGLPPWSGMGKELRALISAAKLDLAKEELAFVSEVLSSPAIKRAPGDFWQLYRPALVALAKSDSNARKRLRHLFPTPSSGASGFPESWIAFMEEAGLVDALLARNEEEPEAGAAAKWLHALISFREGDACLRPYLDRFRARLLEDKVPLDISHGWGTVGLSLAEHAAALEIPIAEPERRRQLSLDVIDCDPVHVAAHPLLRPLLIDAVAGAIGGVNFETAALGKQGFIEARRAWLESQLELLEHGTIVSFGAGLLALSKKSTARLFAEFPDLYARLQALTLAPALGRTLRGGLFAEFSWPVWEQAVKELGTGVETRVGGFFPYPVLSNAVKAIAVSGQKRLGEHDFVLPTGARLTGVYWFDGQFLVIFYTRDGSKAYWSAEPNNLFEFSSYLYSYASDLDVGVPTSAGFVTRHGTLHAGSHKLEGGSVVCDGHTFWKSDWQAGTFRLLEMNAATGVAGRASWPAFVAPLSERSDGFRLNAVWMCPVPEGAENTPLGAHDGVCGFAVRHSNRTEHEITGVDGRSVTAGVAFDALTLFPADTQIRALEAKRFWRSGEARYGATLYGPDGQPLGTYGDDEWASHGFGAGVPVSCWHFFSVRDEAASVVLRALTDDSAAPLVSNEPSAAREAVTRTLPRGTADALCDAVVGAALEAGRLQAELSVLVRERAPERAEQVEEGVLNDSEIGEALGALNEVHWSHSPWTPEVTAVSRFLLGEQSSISEASSHPWETWLGSLRALAVLWALPATEASARLQIRRALATLRRSGLVEELPNLRLFAARRPTSVVAGGMPDALVSEGQSRYFVRTANHYGGGEGLPLRILERAPNAEFRAPNGVNVESEQRFTERGDAAWLDAFLALEEPTSTAAEAKGKELIVAEHSGLTRAECCWLLFGLGKMRRYGSDLLGKELREAIEIKLSDLKVAHDTFRNLGPIEWLRLLDAVAPENPHDLVNLDVLAARLGTAWANTYGKRVTLREELVVAVERELDPPVKSVDLLGAVLNPAQSPLLQVRETDFDTLFAWEQPKDRFSGAAVRAIAHLIVWGFGALPVDDEYRNGLVRLHEAALVALADPTLLLPLSGMYDDPKNNALKDLFTALGGELKTTTADDDKVQIRDSGMLVGMLIQNQYSLRLHAAVRTARCLNLATEELLWRFDASGASGLAAAVFLQSEACQRLIARIRSTPVPAGAYENNPLLSAPETHQRAQTLHGISSDAAQLYLQLLALSEPTNKNVTLWNGWKPAQLKRAGAELLSKGLVVEGKRERAGRDLFLPGGWEKSAGKALPMETWKGALYRLPRGAFARTLPPLAAHELFEAALARVERSDVPKLEEV
ncbi:MAG: hypothetical protein ACOY0T_26160 [Myxococcota bacterium]